MKISYDREADIMMIEISKEKIDYAEESGTIIIHFSKKNRPVLLEILDASEFLSLVTKASIRAKKEELIDIGI